MESQIEKVFKNRGIRPTAMRLLVYRFLVSCKTAKTLNAIENAFDMADRTTLYRTIKLFKKRDSYIKLITELELPIMQFAKKVVIVFLVRTYTCIFIATNVEKLLA